MASLTISGIDVEAQRKSLEEWRDWRRGNPEDLTADEWQLCPDPEELIHEVKYDRASERQLRLYASGCCRMVWRNLVHRESKAAVEAAELYADGRISVQELQNIRAAAKAVRDSYHSPSANDRVRRPEYVEYQAAMAAVSVCTAEDGWPFWEHTRDVVEFLGKSAQIQTFGVDEESLLWTLACLLRDFFPRIDDQVELDAACRQPQVLDYARLAYENRLPSGLLDNARLSDVANMLEQYGCADAKVLSHLRNPGIHVRGCWPIDLLLGYH